LMALCNFLSQELHHCLQEKALLKIISGLNNFDQKSVEQISKAAGIGGGDLLDIACDPELVGIASKNSGLPVCVSSVEPALFPPAVEAGASIIEIGNFDTFYTRGRFFDAKEVFDLAIETRNLLPGITLSVTVPHILTLDKQAQLALELAEIGVDLIQTEGGTSAKPFSPGSLGLVEKAAPTLAAVHTISAAFAKANCHVPILCASGLSDVTIPMAIAAGASGVGVGSAINLLPDEVSMIASIRRLRESFVPSSSFSIREK